GTAPVLSVYGAELFATSNRAARAGMAAAASALGASTGLLALPAMTSGARDFGRGLAFLAAGPALLAILLATRFPESAGTELEGG
ncbi:MAG TPA: hypothetical protein VFN61_13340, partial [Acidimicrobiales bacterium]|nr:hypothetical protein [Acidimicrobiales bacterium]